MTSSRTLLSLGLRRAVSSCLMAGLGFMAAAPAVLAANHSVSLDVPYVPTPPEVVNRMLEVAQVGPEDFVIDLGSGDGRIAIAAVKEHGAKGSMGVDIDPQRIAEAQANAKEAGVQDKVEFRNQNLFETDFSQATVLTMYLLPDVNMSLRPKILELKPGTRVVSHAFDMDDWEADHYERVDGRSVYLWVVPAKAEGRWKLDGPDGAMDLELSQDLQKLSGTLRDVKGQSQAVTGALRGKAIRLTVGEGAEARTFTGTVEGGSMLLAAAGTSKHEWKGSRQ